MACSDLAELNSNQQNFTAKYGGVFSFGWLVFSKLKQSQISVADNFALTRSGSVV
jgi:hypothetical protein